MDRLFLVASVGFLVFFITGSIGGILGGRLAIYVLNRYLKYKGIDYDDTKK